MIRLDRRAGSVLLVLAIAVVSDTSAAKVPKSGALPNHLPTLPPKSADPAPAPAPAPEVLGWPRSILTASGSDCAREPGPNEVLISRDGNFTGTCAVLTPGFYPFAANLLVGNDAITSIKVGANVRARAFKDPVYSGGWNVYPPGTRTGGLGGFNDTISSMRIEPANRLQTCDDLREGEIALFEHPQLAGDCVVLPATDSYANAEIMGLRNDSISSIRNNSNRRMIVYWHPNFSKSGLYVEAHSRADRLTRGGLFTDGIDDDISSVRMVDAP